MEKLRKALDKLLSVLAGGSMAVMVILTTYQVITRYIFKAPSTWSEELVGYLFGWSTMFGATIVSGERGHMRIPIIIDRFSPTLRKAFHIFGEVIAFLFSATILVFGGYQVSNLAMGQQTSSLGVAVGVFYWVMPICGVVILLYSVMNIIGIANGSINLDASDEATEAIAKVEAEKKASKKEG
jgi:TRAP-type C4-dicarboxylate transport system permease small subunit